ncbi:MAG TPA: hypothetical protein DDY32_01360 [Desulfobulbaceae bacterium]|nr:hypothetical protein [Desulfobulbaceae bacterium]
MKERTKKGHSGQSAKVLYLPLFCLLANGCSYYGGQFTYFDFTEGDKKTLADKKAAEKFWASVRPKSSLSDAQYRLGLHYQQMGEYDKAISEFTKALRFDSSYCKAFNGIAMTYDLQKRCEPAHNSYEQAIQCDPGEAYVYNNYACSSLLCGSYGKGMELLQKAESLAASDIRIKNNLRIAQTIAIRENLSGYLVSENLPQPVATDGAPSIAAQDVALPDPVPTIPDENAMNVVPSQEVSEMVTDNPPARDEIATESSAREIFPALPQTAKTDIPSAANKEIIAVATPAIPSPEPIKVAIEVSNGNGTSGMAKRSADFLRGLGFTVRSVTNAKDFRFEESVIYYKEEHLQAAKDLAAVIPGAQNLEKVESMAKPSIGVRVLLGRDLASIRFPDDYSELADYRRSEQLQPAVVTVSNDLVHY